MAARKPKGEAGGLFEAVDGEFAALLAIPGEESPSGPGTTTFRAWPESERRLVTLTYRWYAGGQESFPARLHGLHLDAETGRPLGLILAKINSDAPWREKLPKSELDLPRIYLFSRIEALECELHRIGDAKELATRLLAEYARFLATSEGKDATEEKVAARWTEYADWIGGGATRREAAKAMAREWIEVGERGEARERAVGRVVRFA